jgi:hypothetical protein
MSKSSAAVAIYSTHDEADAAIKSLQKSGFDMKKLSILGKDFHTEEHAVGYYNTGDRVKFWGKTGAFSSRRRSSSFRSWATSSSSGRS